MAMEPWNHVNVRYPSAVSGVRISLPPAAVMHVKSLLEDNNTALKLIHCEILQTEIRVLYELLHILNNSFRGNKTFKGLKQVEQCVNRLKNMKLDAALQELSDICSNKFLQDLTLHPEEYDVPSQPKLEWMCLKVLGGAQLMSCTLSRCSRAFVLSKQQMKWEEFVILNVVITSMLSRLWVIFRAVLVTLSSLYGHLLELLRNVAQVRPMPYLTDFSLPADLAQFLDPPGASLLKRHLALHRKTKELKSKKSSLEVKVEKMKEDLGVAIERGVACDADLKPVLRILRDFSKGDAFQEKGRMAETKQKLKTQVRRAASFTNLATHLEELILWSRSHRMAKEQRLLSFLHLKCQKMKCLEAAGYIVERKLRAFRRAVCWAASPRGLMPNTFRSLCVMRRNARHRRTRFQSLRSRFMSSKSRTVVKEKQPARRHDGTELSECVKSKADQRSRTNHEMTRQIPKSDSHNDIDDIFASMGL